MTSSGRNQRKSSRTGRAIGEHDHHIRDTQQLGKLLRAYRKSRGLSQADAAALAGVGERFLSELEHGKPTAEVGLVLKVIDRFGLTLLLGRRGGGPLLGGSA